MLRGPSCSVPRVGTFLSLNSRRTGDNTCVIPHDVRASERAQHPVNAKETVTWIGASYEPIPVLSVGRPSLIEAIWSLSTWAARYNSHGGNHSSWLQSLDNCTCGREAHGLSMCVHEHLLPEAHPESRLHSQTPDLEPGQRLQVLIQFKFSCCLWLRRGPFYERFWICEGVSWERVQRLSSYVC